MTLHLSDFDYDLPAERIAQVPLEPRDASKLLVLNRENGEIEHRLFRDLGSFLNTHDVLVINETRVIPARIYARKATGGKVEILLLKRLGLSRWEALVGGKRINAGSALHLITGIEGIVAEELPNGRRIIDFSQPVEDSLRECGVMPLPPYIHEKLNDPERYQTIYSRWEGSVAAPTAGLHFTQRLITELESKGVQFARITLHVGLDTFAPVKEDDPSTHKIHSEWCEVTEVAAETINRCVEQGGRVIAVGTTSVRTLETAAKRNSRRVDPYSGPTELFILPGYKFKIVDAMVTNFHLPKSTLLMLVSAFAGREMMLNTYKTAIKNGYRFFSFGDAMLIF